jgi:hypothetical protein
MKEPNGTLVMTTCKCRENTSNLVMTRVWFEEQLQSKIAQGKALELKRILGILESTPFLWMGNSQIIQVSRDALIQIVKEEI